VDISHDEFEDQIQVVNETLAEIDGSNKPTIMVFNKIDAYTFVEKEEDDLTPRTKENISLEEMMNTWMAKENLPCIFISAKEKTNLHELRELIYSEIKEAHAKRFPYNEFLY